MPRTGSPGIIERAETARTTAAIVIAALALLLPQIASAQSALSIVDVLPPYDLSATLLSNGHFSITTKYTGEVKTLIYQEDGSGGRPVNYTSHVHFKVDDVIFQLPYELDPVTRQSPPQNPLDVIGIYRDTLAGTPRVNADMIGVMPDGDTMRFTLRMEPVKRPSGGFIRITAEAQNTSGRARDVGVLMLIDTKIGDNDRAPIISAFGYETTETEFDRGVGTGLPPFWLGLEGSPTAPGLTARGNIVEEGLVTPDYFLFGNWKDNTAINAVGLALAQWDERRATPQGYTDSSVLLLWLQRQMARGQRRVIGSTEIGLVDSLGVAFGGGGWGGAGLAGGGIGGGGGNGGGCLAFDTLSQTDCGDGTFRPYAPDSLQALFLFTNETAPQIDGATVGVENLPAGLEMPQLDAPVAPSTLTTGVTGVAALTFVPVTRLYDTTYRVPIIARGNGGTEIVRDTLCIFVPGVPAELDVDARPFLPVCPNLSDTTAVPVELEGTLCLDLLPNAEIIPSPSGAPGDVAQFSLVAPGPTQIPANGIVGLPISYTAPAVGGTHRVRLVVNATVRGLDRNDMPSSRIVSDTVELVGTAREAEFTFGSRDTVDFGAICIGDTLLRELTVTNLGGCDLRLLDTYTFEGDPLGQFSVADPGRFPLLVPRTLDSTILIRFTPKSEGVAEARFIVRSDAIPFVDTIIVRGIGDAPRYLATPPDPIDTVCPGRATRLSIRIENPTACPVPIDAITTDDPAFAVDAPNGFVLPPESARSVFVDVTQATPGTYPVTVTFASADAGDTSVTMNLVVASRGLTAPATLDFGDVRVGTTSGTQTITITSNGTAGTEITNVRVTGPDGAEFALRLPVGTTLPLRLEPGERLDLEVDVTPADIELRRASVVVATSGATTCTTLDPIELTARGVLPVLDIVQRRLIIDEICIGDAEPIDTIIELRNRGNAPLTVTSAEALGVSGELAVEIGGLPVTIEPDSLGTIPVTLSPSSLGPLVTTLRFTHDGEYLVPSDTTMRLEGTGIVCGTIRLDTVRALVGTEAVPALRFDGGSLGLAEIAQMMRDAGFERTTITVGYDRTIWRPDRNPPAAAAGILAAADRSVDGASGTITIDLDPASAAIGVDAGPDGDLLALLPGDVLLGNSDRTPLVLSVGTFADGFARLDVRNGLLVAEYCAIDRRFVSLAKPFIRSVTTPTTGGGLLQLWLPESADARVRLFDPLGSEVGTLVDGRLGEGTHHVALPGDLSSGLYLVELTTDEESRRVVVLVE